MELDTFWEMIDDARTEAGDDDERFLQKLQADLMELPPNAIEAFRDRFNEEIARSYRWDLWGAAYIINNGSSEGSFEHFRAWLISRGRTVFEAALVDPESLSVLVSDDPEWLAEFEELLFLPIYVYEQKTGKEVPLEDDFEASPEPEGEPWDENTVKERFPKLAKQAEARLS